jgi:hypothetical protein
MPRVITGPGAREPAGGAEIVGDCRAALRRPSVSQAVAASPVRPAGQLPAWPPDGRAAVRRRRGGPERLERRESQKCLMARLAMYATLRLRGIQMWIRSILLLCAAGCVDAGDAAPAVATATDATAVPFECLNHTSIHVVTCSGVISLFPISITIEDLRVLSDNELTILSGDLDELAVLDGGIVNHGEILDRVEALVLDDVLGKFAIEISGDDVVVCTSLAGPPICL